MATNNKISTLIENQFPGFFIEDGPVFVDFIKAYYEWLEQEKNAVDATQNVLNYRDIDETLDEYIKYFFNEVIPSIPDEVVGDKRLFIKYAIEFYRGKGSEASYKLLFRMLFNEDITVYYPTEDILRVSDGRWVEESSIRLGNPKTGDLDKLEGQEIKGLSSGAVATVDRVIRGFESGILVREVFVTNSDGAFFDGELVSNEKTGDDLIQGTVVSFVGTLFDVDPIFFRGRGHQIGDIVNITGAGGSGAKGEVTLTSDNSAIGFSVSDGGSGYRKGEEFTNVYGGSGVGADFAIESIVNTEIIQFNTDKIDPVKNVVLGTEPYFISNGANTSAVSNSFATANISTTLTSALAFSNLEIGSIGSVVTTDSGSGYSVLPSASVYDNTIWRLRIPDGQGGYKGKNAIINTFNLPGAIEDIKVTESGGSYTKYRTVTLTNTVRANTENARGLPNITGIKEYEGKYIDTKGFVSWNPKIQDNFFYQKFSYVINSDQFLTKYRNFVRNLLHPSGTKLFGSVRNYDDIQSKYYNDSNTLNEYIVTFTKGTATISVTNSSFTVTGSNTVFTSELNQGTNLKISSGLYTVNSISSNTQLTLTTVFEGSTNSNIIFYYANNV